MSECCAMSHTGDVPTCPMNDQATKAIGRKTVESLVKPEVRAALISQPYNFCDAPDCDTVYVSTLGDHLITKDMLTVRVGIKETDDPILSVTASRMTRRMSERTFVGGETPRFSDSSLSG